MNFLSTDAHAKRLRYNENAFVILALQAFDNIDKRLAFKTFEGKIGSPDFQERTAFRTAPSKVRSTAMTSPVAFICVPKVRSARANFSKGHRET